MQRFNRKLIITLGAVGLIAFMSGLEQVRVIHHYAAFVLALGAVYHLITSAYRLFVQQERMRVTPQAKDARNLVDWVRHNLGLLKEPPQMAKFNFSEKIEYWTVVWGMAVMSISGFMLLNPVAVTAVLPGQFILAARAAHGGETVLAVLSILTWHIYNVLIKQRNFSMFTGKLPHNQMEEEHALELERLERGESPWPELALPILQRRQRIFIIASIIIGGLMLAGLVWAFTFEETAVTTIPHVTRELFTPLETPGP